MTIEDFTQEVMRSLGRIEQKIDDHGKWMEKHVVEDRLMASDIKSLEISQARQRGAMTVLASVGTVLGAGVGFAVDFFTRSHHG